MARFLHGTCGFAYGHWGSGVFYPRGLRPADRLAYYASRFPLVEIDATFYRLPSRETVARWRAATPDGFRFCLKGSRLVTHLLRLDHVEKAVGEFFDRAEPLGDKLECVLWQTPPTLRADAEVLERFCELLARETPPVRHAFEFRHASWGDERALGVLSAHGHALVIADPPRGTDALRLPLTAPFAYLRFHQGDPARDGEYGRGRLRAWAERTSGWLAEGRDVYALFNNDWHGHAPADAAALADLVAARESARAG